MVKQVRRWDDDEKALAKAVFLTHDTPWDVQEALKERFGEAPSWGLLRSWVQNVDVVPTALYMAEFVKAVNGRISAMTDELLEKLHSRIVRHVEDPEFESYDLMQEIKSFGFLVGNMRPLEFRGGSAQAANIYLGPTTIDARTVNMPFGPKEPRSGLLEVPVHERAGSEEGAQESA
jgi:hypothetical protein